jgi:phosphopantothenoylcysteine synthetase/decarboxylase
MRCIVTAGPTYEPLDQVRRLTNFSTGCLGTGLANHLHREGHDVTLLLGEQSTWHGESLAPKLIRFGTTTELSDRLAALAGPHATAVFHTCAVSDFAFGRIWENDGSEDRREIRVGKIGTVAGSLLAELLPTPKLIRQLRDWFPLGFLTGWKYDVDGDRESVLKKARQQIRDNRTNLCIANGPAYGNGFGLVQESIAPIHCEDREALYAALSETLAQS